MSNKPSHDTEPPEDPLAALRRKYGLIPKAKQGEAKQTERRPTKRTIPSENQQQQQQLRNNQNNISHISYPVLPKVSQNEARDPTQKSHPIDAILSAITNASWLKWLAVIIVAAVVWRFFNLLEIVGTNVHTSAISTLSTIVGVISAVSSPRPHAPTLAQWSLIPPVPHIDGLVPGLRMIQGDVSAILKEKPSPELGPVRIPLSAAESLQKDITRLNSSLEGSLGPARYQLNYLIEMVRLDPASQANVNLNVNWLAGYLDSFLGYSSRRRVMTSRCTDLVKTLETMQTSRQSIREDIIHKYQKRLDQVSTETCQASENLKKRRDEVKRTLTPAEALAMGSRLSSFYQYVQDTSIAAENLCTMASFDAKSLKEFQERMEVEIKDVASSEHAAREILTKLKRGDDTLSERVIDSIESGYFDIAMKELNGVGVYYRKSV